MQKFYSSGKLLLSGEYLILDGAAGIGLPTALGQEMLVSNSNLEGVLSWESLDESGVCWFEGSYSLPDLKLIRFKGQQKVADTLQSILMEAKLFKPAIVFPNEKDNSLT